MTSATVAEVVRVRRPRERVTLRGDLIARLKAQLAETSQLVFPLVAYQRDPVGFARDVMGYVPCRTVEEIERALTADAKAKILWEKQIEILEAAANHPRVAVASGHKISKSHTAAILTLWFYCCFDQARVVLSSVTARQVDRILWRELRMLRAHSKETIPGKMGELARTGLVSSDFREAFGFTARDAEAVAGISGKNLLYVLDEASGIEQLIFDAIEGNRAGGARLVMFSNPTQTSGEFFEAFNEKKGFYHCIRVSSEETPNAVTGRTLIAGLAGREWIDEKRREWGEESPLYKVRVKGEFVLNEEGRVVSLHLIGQCEQRWFDAAGEGRLQIGIDPAGPGLGGDESAYVVRRGQKVLAIVAMRGLTEEGHLANLLGIIKEHARPREPEPLITVDREGAVGAAVYGTLRAYAEANDGKPGGFELHGIRSSERARREPKIYERIRDELWMNLARWLKDGGAIPEDSKLAKELHLPAWESTITGRLRVTPKDELRKLLERSPDRADALALAVWEPIAHAAPPPAGHGSGSGGDEPGVMNERDAIYGGPAADPYDLDGGGGDRWG